MKLATALVLVAGCAPVFAHDPITTKITWDREVSRLIFVKCIACHRDGGQAFSLATYDKARPWAAAIKEETLERKMPPFGAVKGFGDLAEDQALSQEQLQLLSDWVEGGAPEGDPALLPAASEMILAQPKKPKTGAPVVVKGSIVLSQAGSFAGIEPADLLPGSSIRVVAEKPDGTIIPLIWIYQYNPKFKRAYFFREPLTFPAGTKIVSSSADAGGLALLTAIASQRSSR
jgi:hypothetical protein